jgi:acyl-CoA hydrolase/GNAT superfamily N-acetyltransferase
MNWQDRYSDKVVSVEDAIAKIRPGRRILIGSGAAEPGHLVEALVEHGAHLAGNDVVHLLTLGPAPYVEPSMSARFRHTAFFIGKNVREAVQEGRADFMPIFLSEIPLLIRSRRVAVDVALIQITPPDRFGFASLGTSVDIVRAAVDSASLVIAQVNRHLPRTLGDSFVDMRRVHYLVEKDEALVNLPSEPLDDVARQIGRHVASLIPDGATLQMGIGQIPDAVLGELGEHNELGVHTEMFSDGAMALAVAGVIDGRRKTLLKGKMVTSFVMGSRELYDWVDDNPQVEFRPSEFTNDPFVIARNDQMVAINSALAVDLTGQVAADTLMGRFFSGIGGQVDFIRGSARSRGGKPVIALRSTAKGGKVSRIQPAFEEGGGVVTSRGDVHYVVTEHGVAYLFGKSIRQRASALIEIAHPDFRGDLLSAAKRRRYVFPDQIAPRRIYPWESSRTVALRDHRRVTIRPARLADEDGIKRLFAEVAGDVELARAFRVERASREELQRMVDLDDESEVAWVATHCPETVEEVVAVGEYRVDAATRLASVALVTREDFREVGLGTALMECFIELARARGLAGFESTVGRDNRSMLDIFHKCGLPIESRPSDDGRYVHVLLRFAPEGEAGGA